MLRLSEREFRTIVPSKRNTSIRPSQHPRRDVPLEHDEQVVVAEWVELARTRVPALEMFFAVPNGGFRCDKTAGELRDEGVKAGVPDVFLDYPVAPFHGLRIEMKRVKGGRLLPDQAVWGERYIRNGYAWHVCRGADEAIAAICHYLGIRNPMPITLLKGKSHVQQS